jgi:hypothetical protein
MLLVSSKEPTLSLFSVLACTYLFNIFNELCPFATALLENIETFPILPQAGLSMIWFFLLRQKRDAKVVTFFGLANFF